MISKSTAKKKDKEVTGDASLHENDPVDDCNDDDESEIIWTALDGKNPIYNFLIEYCGLKGAKGPRGLSRWSPNPQLLSHDDELSAASSSLSIQNDENEVIVQYISLNGEIKELSGSNDDLQTEMIATIMSSTQGRGGIFLENANENDLNGVLNLRGATPITTSCTVPRTTTTSKDEIVNDIKLHGMLYNPYLFYNKQPTPNTKSTTAPSFNNENNERILQLQKTIAPFQWYKSILQTTLDSEPIFHCHGLHEWAMLYHPPNAPSPPSAKYQKDLPIRVSRQVINETVERRGISCTHVDALWFFAPAAGPLNHHGSSLERIDQLRLEQKGCVHAHMDLLKIALKLQPFLDGPLLCDVLEVSIAARRLDVEASPYDVRGL